MSAFNAERVEYLLVGAYALAAHGAPRATRDIDLWIRPTRENAHRVWQALARTGRIARWEVAMTTQTAVPQQDSLQSSGADSPRPH